MICRDFDSPSNEKSAQYLEISDDERVHEAAKASQNVFWSLL